jgi:general stress protein YciG
MNTQSAGFEVRTTNAENPRVAVEEPKTVAAEGLSLSPDRPPTPPSSPPPSASDSQARPRRPRGFAAMDRTLVSEIARKGGKAAHTAGTAHEFTSDEAREAGRKGGRATHAKRQKTDGEAAVAPAAETSAGATKE